MRKHMRISDGTDWQPWGGTKGRRVYDGSDWQPWTPCRNLVVEEGVWITNGNYVASTKITFENSSDHFQLAVPVVAGEKYSISRQSKLSGSNDRFRYGFTKTDPSVTDTAVYGYQSKDKNLPLNLDGIIVPADCVWFIVYLGYGPHGVTLADVKNTNIQVELGLTSTAYTDCGDL